MPDHIAVASEAARIAGEMMKSRFGAFGNVEHKADRTLVTEVDKKSERIIMEALLSAFPDHGILGEEFGERAGSSAYTWIIDPLDGTHNYIRGIPVYGVSIGLRRGDEIVAGVIYLPTEDLLYCAEKGAGARRNGEPIRVSNCANMDECACTFDSGLRVNTERKVATLRKIASRVFNVRMSGSSARNLTFLAEGTVDMVVEFDDRAWDFAAGFSLVNEAGGRWTNHEGGPFGGDRTAYVATNGLLHSAAVDTLR